MSYKRYRRYRRRYRRKSRYNKYNVGFTRRLSAMAQMRDIARFSIKVTGTLKMGITNNSKHATYFISFYVILQRNKQFQALSILFDQVQLRGASITMRPKFNKSLGTAFENNLKYVSAIDRTGLVSITPNAVNNGYVVNNLTFNDICGYGSAKLNVMDTSSKNTIYHKIVATDLMERSQYIDTSVIRAMLSSQLNTNFNGYNLTIGNFVTFNPTLMFGIELPAVNTTGVQQTFDYDFSINYDLQFRGTRFDNEAVSLDNNHYGVGET